VYDPDHEYGASANGDHAVGDVRQWAADFVIALGFLTCLPVPEGAAGKRSTLAGAMRAFPAAGALAGFLSGVVFAAALAIGPPTFVAALVAAAAGIVLTGAMHEDGLADVADGLGGGRNREEKLDIMRDSRTGAFGVLALIFAVALKASALASLAGPDGGTWAAMAVLIASAAGSRAAVVGLLYALPPARQDGLSVMAGRPGRGTLLQAAGLAWAIGIIVLWCPAPIFALIGLPIACLAGVLIMGWIANRQIGGQTGDVAGATQVVSELFALILAASVLGPAV
jgi:adenosylcobinamide-GDP ribazoletransferase